MKNLDFEFNPNDLYKEYKTKNLDEIWLKKLSSSHCSAFVKILKKDSI